MRGSGSANRHPTVVSFCSRIALYALVSVLSACASGRSRDLSGSSVEGPIKVNVCNSAASGTQIVTVYALEKGVFARHGLDVTLISINSGSRAVAALLSGSVQICQIAGSAVTYAAISGADVVMVGGLINGYMYSLMVSANIRSASDLKGKAVAVSASGSASETAVRIALRTLGLQPDRDVAILSIGNQAERLAALDAGYVVGTLIGFPETIVARQRGLHTLLDLSTLDLPNLQTGVATTKAFLKSDRATVLNFMKALTEAVFLVKRDRQGTMAVLGKNMHLDLQKDAAALEETYDVLYRRKLADIPYPTLEGIDAELAEIARENPAAARFRPEEIADRSIVRELQTSGFFERLSASR